MIRVLMFGWEFPPSNSGGLGTACYGLTKGLNKNNVAVTFVLPRAIGNPDAKFVKLVSTNLSKIKMIGINSPIRAYMNSEGYQNEIMVGNNKISPIYGRDLFEEVYKYSIKAKEIAKNEPHDVIHAHDWMTFKAGINAKKVSHKPLIIHVHATEFDRTGGHGINQFVFDAEKEGMQEADKIIAVSNFTKEKIVNHYNIDPDKIEVVHNAVEFTRPKPEEKFGINDKIVLFLGRITLQKGPDYFVEAAKKVIDLDENVKFIIAGSGDMEPKIIEKAAELGISDKVLFSGFLKGEDTDRAYQLADLYVMPSVSEPFGITPLEAMKNNTPVIISKQSGVSEVISHCLKVDFWDIDELANKILAVLKYKELDECLKENAATEVRKFDWDIPAKKCIDIYNKTMGAD